jgi:hypothetical protein
MSTRLTTLTLTAAVLLAGATLAAAGGVICRDSRGKVTLQDTPCQETQTTAFQVPTPAHAAPRSPWSAGLYVNTLTDKETCGLWHAGEGLEYRFGSVTQLYVKVVAGEKPGQDIVLLTTDDSLFDHALADTAIRIDKRPAVAASMRVNQKAISFDPATSAQLLTQMQTGQKAHVRVRLFPDQTQPHDVFVPLVGFAEAYQQFQQCVFTNRGQQS